MYSVLGLGLIEQPSPFRDTFYNSTTGEIISGAPNSEYKSVGMFIGQFMWTLRFSMGDFSGIAASVYLRETENGIFWFIWIITVGITCIIFLNFIVAEASASYTKVTETLDSVIWMETAAMVSESEDMAFNNKNA